MHANGREQAGKLWKGFLGHVSEFDVCTAVVTGFLELILDSRSPPRSRDGDRALGRIAVQMGFIQVSCPAMTYA